MSDIVQSTVLLGRLDVTIENYYLHSLGISRSTLRGAHAALLMASERVVLLSPIISRSTRLLAMRPS